MKTKRERIEDFKESIRNSNLDKLEVKNMYGKLVGTMYAKEKMDYGFHVYFIYEPDIDNPLAGVNGTVSEMYYDLRNREYWIKRNMSEVKFSVRNIDSMFNGNMVETFKFISTPNNEGLYERAYSYLGAMGEERSRMFGRFFYRLITEHSYFEILHKSGIRMNNVRIRNINGTSPAEILGLTKTQWKMFSRYGVSQTSFGKAEHDSKAINFLAYVKSLEDEFGIDKIRVFVGNEFSYIYGQGGAWRSALRTAERYNLPVKKFIRYIYFECDVSQGLDPSMAIGQYDDYIRMTTEMGYERFDRYPKFLRTAHDIASRNYRIKLNEVEMKEWDKAVEGQRKYEGRYGDYKILTPEKPEDLVREGNILGHCVGSYVNKVRKGLSTILFLRELSDEEYPLVTIEVRNGQIVQAKGKMNNKPLSKEVEAIKRFAEKNNLTIGGF